MEKRAAVASAWEQRKLGDVARRVTRKNEGHESDLPLTISAQNGLVDQRSFFNNQVASKDMSGYYLLHKGEFAYNKSTSSDSPWGAIKRLTKYEKGCVSTLYICFELLGADPDWLVAYYETNRWHRGVQLIAAEGARNHGLLNIAPDDFFDTVLTMPGLLEEQCQIGAFFSRLDNLITLHQRKYDSLCSVKKSMLQKMFPRDGASEPEIRFAGFTDPWEQRKWSETFQVLPNNTLSRADLNSAEGKLRNVHYGDILIKYRERIDASLTEFPYISDPDTASKYMNATLQEGDVVFADTAEDEAVGKCVELRELHGTPVVSGLHTIPCRPVEEFADGYLGYFLNSVSYHNQLVPLMQGIKVTSISKGAIADTCVCYPSYEEQVQIGAYFTQLDNLITLHQRELDLLRKVKQSMLQKMFV